MHSFLRRFKQLGRHRPRLVLATVGGALLYFLLPAHWPAVSRALSAWNAGVWAYLLSMAWLMLRASPERARAIAEQENASTGATLAVLSMAAVLSFVAIVLELGVPRSGAPGGSLSRYGLTVLTIAGSWLLVGTLYTFHYAHMFYEADGANRPLRFPDGLANPSYLDFLYFSFTIAVAAQTSDVTVLSTPMRTAVIAQSVLSFVFNLAILGLSINIAAGLVGAHQGL